MAFWWWMVPSDTTFYRILNTVDCAHFERIIATWLLEHEIGQLKRLAVDGKVLRGSGRGDGKPLALLPAVTHHLRTTIKSVPIAEKSNEPSRREASETGCRQAGRSPTEREQGSQIPAIIPLLEGLPLEGSLITADAMHCQQETARFITQDLGADYLIGLKGNQSGILERAQCKLSPVFFPPEKYAPWVKEHGRIVRRLAKAVSLSPEEIGLCG
ncbi:MAG: hypothetical protein Fur0032_23930 [Terrimicrobiaceae bacterium]